DWRADSNEPLVSVQIAATAHLTTFGPPLVLLTLVLASFLGVGLLRSSLADDVREWLASVSAWLLAGAAAWTAANLVGLYGTPFVMWASPWILTALTSGWLLALAAGILAGSGARTGAQRPSNLFRELVARLALSVFAVGVVILISLLLHVTFDNPPNFESLDEANWP